MQGQVGPAVTLWQYVLRVFFSPSHRRQRKCYDCILSRSLCKTKHATSCFKSHCVFSCYDNENLNKKSLPLSALHQTSFPYVALPSARLGQDEWKLKAQSWLWCFFFLITKIIEFHHCSHTLSEQGFLLKNR